MGIGLGHKRHPGLMVLIVSAVIALDQLTKWQITRMMRLHESLPVIPGLFSITYIRNSGAAFGILAGSHAGFRLLFFGLTTVLALALLGTIYVRLSPADWAGQASVSAIFGGAVGNRIDPIRSRRIIDFLDFSLMGHHWPPFKVAYAVNTVGLGFLFLGFLRHNS